MPIRLNKAIADMGICSRRKADVLIAAGNVFVNGVRTTTLATVIDPQKDTVTVPGFEKQHIPKQTAEGTPLSKLIYIALNKPVDYISSTSDEQGPSVLDLITEERYKGKKSDSIQPALDARLYPVGRLDKDSEGLIIVTNDGDITNTLTHPRYEHEKEYEVTIDQHLSKQAHRVLEAGMHIGDDTVRGVTILDVFNKGRTCIITLVLQEGKNRQIRRMFGALGYQVLSLKRTRIGNVQLGNLPIGTWKFISKTDLI